MILHREQDVGVGGIGPVFRGGQGFQPVDGLAGLLHAAADLLPVVPGGLDAALGVGGLVHGLLHGRHGVVQAGGQAGELGQQVLLHSAGDHQLPLAQDGLGQVRRVAVHRRENAPHDHIPQGSRLDGRDLAVILQVNFIPGPHLRLAEDVVTGEQADVLGVDIGGHAVHGVPQVAEAPALGLPDPVPAVAVAVEDEITALPSLDCKLEWRMLSISESTKEADKIVLNKNGKKRYLSAQVTGSSKEFQYMTWETVRPSTWKDRDWDPLIEDRTIVGWTLTVPKGETVKIITKLTK